MKITNQIESWSGQFGKDYTDRNPIDSKQMNELYLKNFGLTRKAMNERFLANIPKSSKILEVGCNVGSQLEVLQDLNFTNLFGIELQNYAVNLAKQRLPTANIKQGNIFELPFAENEFDLVFTSGVLIHINPNDLNVALNNIIRCSKKYIWGFEYYSVESQEINYRGNSELLWKDNYAKRYLELNENLTLINSEKYQYLDSNNVDDMFLIEKKS